MSKYLTFVEDNFEIKTFFVNFKMNFNVMPHESPNIRNKKALQTLHN